MPRSSPSIYVDCRTRRVDCRNAADGSGAVAVAVGFVVYVGFSVKVGLGVNVGFTVLYGSSRTGTLRVNFAAERGPVIWAETAPNELAWKFEARAPGAEATALLVVFGAKK